MYIFRLVARNLPRNLRRSVLTALTVSLATFIFAVLVSVPDSINRIVSDASATLRLIVVNRSLPLLGMPAHYCDRIRAIPGCAACVATTLWPATFFGGNDQILAVAEGLEIADVFPDYDLSGDARRALYRERRPTDRSRGRRRRFRVPLRLLESDRSCQGKSPATASSQRTRRIRASRGCGRSNAQASRAAEDCG